VRVSVCSSVLPCISVCCSVLQCVAVRCSVSQCVGRIRGKAQKGISRDGINASKYPWGGYD